MFAHVCLCLRLFVYASVRLDMIVYGSACSRTRVYACICLVVFVCMCLYMCVKWRVVVLDCV